MAGNIRLMVVVSLFVTVLGWAASEARERVMVAGVEGSATVRRGLDGTVVPLAAGLGLRDGDTILAGATAVRTTLLDLSTGSLIVVDLPSGISETVPAILQPRKVSTWRRIAGSLHAAIFGAGEIVTELGGVRDGQSNDPAPATSLQVNEAIRDRATSHDEMDLRSARTLRRQPIEAKKSFDTFAATDAEDAFDGDSDEAETELVGSGGGGAATGRPMAIRRVAAASRPAPPAPVYVDKEESSRDVEESDDLGFADDDDDDADDDAGLRDRRTAVFGTRSGAAVPRDVVEFRTSAVLDPIPQRLQIVDGSTILADVALHPETSGYWAVVDLSVLPVEAGRALTCRLLVADGSPTGPPLWIRLLETAAYRELQHVREGLRNERNPAMYKALLLLLAERYRAAGAPGYALAAYEKLKHQSNLSTADRTVVETRLTELEAAVAAGP